PTQALYGDDPLLFLGWYYAAERAGQGLVQAFFTVSALTDARTLLTPTLLLGPALLVLAVFALCSRFGLPRGTALLAGAAAGLLPGVALIQLEGLLSQTLATPLLLYGLVALDELVEKPGPGRLAVVCLLFGGIISFFPEFVLLLAGVVGLTLLLTIPRPA